MPSKQHRRNTLIGTIQQAKRSQSGQTLSIQVDGQWYTSKNWELEQAVNRRIIFEPSHSPASGNFPAMNWLNDYVFEDQQTTPAGQAMDQAMQATQAGNVPRGTPNKDSLIGAMALCKCCTPGTPDQIFENFQLLYHKLESWDSSVPF